MQRQISFAINHLELLARRIACQKLDDISFLVAAIFPRHPISKRCQGARCLVATLEKHFLERIFIEELKELLERFHIGPSSSEALLYEHAVSHIPSDFVTRSLVGTNGDEI